MNGNEMTTFTGKRCDSMQMNEKDICIEDIAHALSLICRGCGQVEYFYSVAQHSLNCAYEAMARGYDNKHVFACL